MQAFPTLADALENIGGQVVVLQVVQPGFDEFAKVEGFRASGLGRQEVQALLGLRGQADGGWQGYGSDAMSYMYSLYCKGRVGIVRLTCCRERWQGECLSGRACAQSESGGRLE